MILLTGRPDAPATPVELDGLFHGSTAMLVGGSPSLKTQNVRLLESRGVLTAAMNNAAVHFRPTLWFSSDDPRCFDPQIIADPGIMKFAPDSLRGAVCSVAGKERPYASMPNMLFYQTVELKDGNAASDWLQPRTHVPWMASTLMHSIFILYSLGVRRIILAGSDFGAGPKGEMYAHASNIGTLETKWNRDLYNAQAAELRTMHTYFKHMGLSILDASPHSRISHVYPKVTLEQAIEMCRESFPPEPADTASLPHCSQFAPETMKRMVAGLPAVEQQLGAVPAARGVRVKSAPEVY